MSSRCPCQPQPLCDSVNNFVCVTIFALQFFACFQVGGWQGYAQSPSEQGAGHPWRYSQALAEGKHFLKACSCPWAKGAQPKHGGDMPVDRGEQSQSRPNYAWLDLNSSCTHPQPGKGPPVRMPLAGLRHQTWAGAVHEVSLEWQKPSKSNTQHQPWWGSLLCEQPHMLPKLEALGAVGMHIPRAVVRAVLGGDGVTIPFVRRKFCCAG